MADATDLYETLIATPSPDLVKPWLVASLELPDHRDATSMRILALSARHERDAAFLDTLGIEAWSKSFRDEAMEVFRAAIAADSKTDMTHMLLGYMLVRQNNAEGVPLLERALADTANWPLPRRALAGWYVTRDPARALVVLASATEGVDLDLRAMANEALGRDADAERDGTAALATYATSLEGHRRLSDYHLYDDRNDRALYHARALLTLATGRKLSASTRDEIDATIASAFRHGNAFAEVLTRFRRRKRAMPKDVGWNVWAALTAMQPNPDPALAIRAAHDVAAAIRDTGDVREALLWTVRAAGVAAKAGDLSLLDALVASGLDDDANAWLEVAHCYLTAEHEDVASAVADRALQLDPESGNALYVMCRIAMGQGDAEALHRTAMALVAQKPMWHQGPEFLARSFARRLDAPAALMHSEKGLALGAYCHNAWTARAEAFLVAGDLAEARTCVDRAIAIHTPKLGDANLTIRAVLDRDADALEAQLGENARRRPLGFTAYVAYLRRLVDRH